MKRKGTKNKTDDIYLISSASCLNENLYNHLRNIFGHLLDHGIVKQTYPEYSCGTIRSKNGGIGAFIGVVSFSAEII